MSTQLVIVIGIFVLGGIALKWVDKDDSLAPFLIYGAVGLVGATHAVVKQRESAKQKKAIVDLEATTTTLRRELFESTRQK